MSDEIEKKLQADTPKPVNANELLSTGATLLDLGCTNRYQGGFPKGKYILIVGDSDSGKTWVSLTCLAEASLSARFDDYRFIVDPAEDGAMMDIAYYFGQKVADRIEMPSKKGPSRTVEEFYYNIDDALKANTPFIYILDSDNALPSEKDLEKFDDRKKASRAGKDESGSYGTAKAKCHSDNLRLVRSRLGNTGSILIIISQTRDRIGFGAQFDPKTRSGGRALKFYADLELWTALEKKLTKKDSKTGKQRDIGIRVQVKIKKNRITGRKPTVSFPIYHSHGIDDVGACVEWLDEEGFWTRVRTQLGAPDGLEKAVQFIENEDLHKELRKLTGQVWKEIEESLRVKRKRRYE